MKKIKLGLFILLFGMIFMPFVAHAQGEGRLILDPDAMLNQTKGNGSATDFPIRAELFSQAMNEKAKAQENEENKATLPIKKADFNKQEVNALYRVDTQSVKADLFKNYSKLQLTNHTPKKESNNQAVLLLGILAIPLLILTGFVARKLTRRKRKR